MGTAKGTGPAVTEDTVGEKKREGEKSETAMERGMVKGERDREREGRRGHARYPKRLYDDARRVQVGARTVGAGNGRCDGGERGHGARGVVVVVAAAAVVYDGGRSIREESPATG